MTVPFAPLPDCGLWLECDACHFLEVFPPDVYEALGRPAPEVFGWTSASGGWICEDCATAPPPRLP